MPKQKPSKQNPFESDGRFYQPVVVFNQMYKVGFHSETLAYPYYAPNVFMEPSQATNFLPIYIKELIKSGDLPEDVVAEDGTLDDTRIKTAVVDVFLTALEVVDETEWAR